MDAWVEKRMWANLLKGVACLVAGALAVLVVEYAWQHGVFGGGEAVSGDGGDGDAEVPQPDLMAFVLNGDDAGIGFTGAPLCFIEECFDPSGLGEVRTSDDGGVVGIVSDLEAPVLFDVCVHKLVDHGWSRVSDGQPLRCSFLKGTGAIRWVFLDVSEVSDSSAAVLVLEEVSEDGKAA
ncbi:MAG: hypothetical protein Q4C36_02480 [Coriobacteriia bacterium]|nr:hypothetical protein [Coriobacteriia bacterium]